MPAKMNAVHALWITMRPYLLFISGITGAAGMAVSRETAPFALLAVFAASFFAYGFGQALTDCFQTDTDAIAAPYRPLVSGLVSRNVLLAMSILGLAACLIVFVCRNPWNLVMGLASAAGLATYTPFKRRWWGGPWYNAWIVVSLCFMGFLGGNGDRPIAFPPPLVPLLATVFLGYANFVLSGYFKDITADASTGYNTFPVRFGRKAAAVASDVLATGFLAAAVWTASSILYGANMPTGIFLALPFAILGLVFLVAAQIQLHRNRTERDAYVPIAYVVHAYLLILSGLSALVRPEWSLLLGGHYGLFIFALSRRPEVSQV
jgi:4-hydroxybenzoate polyprenyltransferase